jgi:hypothetical protein
MISFGDSMAIPMKTFRDFQRRRVIGQLADQLTSENVADPESYKPYDCHEKLLKSTKLLFLNLAAEQNQLQIRRSVNCTQYIQ